MQHLCTIFVQIGICNGSVKIVKWTRDDPFPHLGRCVGVDTETELITETCKVPNLVVLGVFDPAHMTCYIIGWRDATAFMTKLCTYDIEQRYFNIGFDESVLDAQDDEQSVLLAADQNRIVDIGVRIHLAALATIGHIPGDLYTLAGCVKHYTGYKLDKGDGTEDSARLSFKRYNEDGTDYELTDEQIRYLPLDCISTWLLGEYVKHQPTEEVHTKGAIVLYHMQSKGIRIDRDVHSSLSKMLYEARDKYRNELLLYGFPDPYKDAVKEAEEVKELFLVTYRNLIKLCTKLPEEALLNWRTENLVPCKLQLRLYICYLWNMADSVEDIQEGLGWISLIGRIKRKTLRKSERSIYDTLCENFGILAIDNAKRGIVLLVYVAKLMESYVNQYTCGDALKSGFDFNKANEYAGAYIDEHPDWLSTSKPMGPKKFFQEHVQELLDAHPSLELDRTEKNKEYKLTLKDMWRLEDANIEDKFLTVYTNFKHADKYISTYLNPADIKEDGRVHPRFTNLLRTGRTSCSKPNIQNLPARDQLYPIRNAYCADEGMILCATDFSFIELVSFAESCLQRFGFSVMADIINAGVDPHRWFAGIRDGLIDKDTSFLQHPEAVEELNKFLEEKVTKASRQKAKAANFGLPGGMSAKRFMITCREQDIPINLDEAAQIRDKWISTFTEMKYHTNPEKIVTPFNTFDQYKQKAKYGYDQEDEEEEYEDEYKGDRYVARLINGMVRTDCSYCAAMNTQFQGLTAYGLKLAMWNLVMAGFLPRMVLEVHDEVLYNLYPEEVKTFVPIVEKCMIDGMRIATPHVKVSVATSCMLHWDKEAIETSSLLWDAQGRPIINEPEFVKLIKAKAS